MRSTIAYTVFAFTISFFATAWQTFAHGELVVAERGKSPVNGVYIDKIRFEEAVK